jgi:hypothetical protein
LKIFGDEDSSTKGEKLYSLLNGLSTYNNQGGEVIRGRSYIAFALKGEVSTTRKMLIFSTKGEK